MFWGWLCDTEKKPDTDGTNPRSDEMIIRSKNIPTLLVMNKSS